MKFDHQNQSVTKFARLSVAPMMAWTDKHCRFFHRLISKNALLYTEMVTAAALVMGDARHLLAHSPEEHPVALQLGGSDANLLKQATEIARDHGFKEVNLNVGCPSDRVKSGSFGAVLMLAPETVARCVSAMMEVQGVEITVKCRIGVDDQNPAEVLPDFLTKISEVGIKRTTIHARKAWLKGLSPKENREIPPLDYNLVYEMVRAFPNQHISINGGVSSIDEAQQHLANGVHGVMIGRAAYHTPFDVLSSVDERIFGEPPNRMTATEIAEVMIPYIEAHLARAGRLHQITRHMLGLFSGQPGARHWRRGLSTLGADATSDVNAYRDLLSQVETRLKNATLLT